MGNVDASLQTASNVVNTVVNIDAIVAQMVEETISKVVKEVGGAYTEYAAKHASKIASLPGEITKESMKVFNEQKMSMGDIIKQITTPAELKFEQDSTEQEKKATSKFISDTKEKMNKVKDKVNKIKEVANEKIPMVLSYIDNGPAWVSSQLDKQVQGFVKNIKDDLDTQWNDVDLVKYQKFINTSASKAGGKLAQKYNKKLQDQADKQLKKVEQVKAKAMTKLKTVAQKAKVLIAAKTGIYIPV